MDTAAAPSVNPSTLRVRSHRERRRERVRLFTIELPGHFIDAARHLAAATRYLRLITLLIFRRQGLRQQGLQRSD